MEINLTYGDVLRIVTARQGCECILQRNMQLTRIATPKFLRELAGSYVGKTYPRSRRGLELAYHDLCELEAAIKRAGEQT